jgi:hypothetical protein
MKPNNFHSIVYTLGEFVKSVRPRFDRLIGLAQDFRLGRRFRFISPNQSAHEKEA